MISSFGKRRSVITLSLILLLLIVSITILSLVPPVSKDALIHHLAVPKLYLNHGGIYEIPFMDFSYYPMNLDLLYMIPLYFGNDIAPKFIHFAFALLTAWLIYWYLRRYTNASYGLLGAVFFLSIPIIIKLSITVYVDLGEIFFSFASLLLIMEWLKKDYQLKYLLYSGLMCGLALGTKYNGLVTLIILLLFVPFLYSRCRENKKNDFIRPVTYGLVFLFISLLVFSPWMIRNYHWKGNPIYPLYNRIFNPPTFHSQTKAETDQENNGIEQNHGFFTYRSMVYHESRWEIALLPIRIFIQGKDGDPQYFDGRLNPFLLFLPFFAFYRLRDDSEDIRREKKIFLAFSVLFFCFSFFTAVLRIRYISPLIPPLVILSVFGVRNLFYFVNVVLFRFCRKLGIVLIVIIVAFCLVLNGEYITRLYKTVDPLSYITGRISRDVYIGRFIPEYSAIKYINDNLSSDDKILFIFLGKRGYYCDKEYLYNIGIIREVIKGAKRPGDILTGLKRYGITHLLVYDPLFTRWMSNNFLDDKILLANLFFKEYVRLIFFERGYAVLSLS